VECEAEERFARLAARLEAQGAAPPLVDLARRASDDERRHADHCARLAAALGRAVPARRPPAPPEVAPVGLPAEDALTYELTAACCVTETVSVAVLTELLPAAVDPALRFVLRDLARDEVGHARLGWAHLAEAAARGRVAFLGPHLPGMLGGTVDDDLFAPVEPEREDLALLPLGVLPHAASRALFVRALQEVIFPGLEGAGVDTTAGRAWLAASSAAPYSRSASASASRRSGTSPRTSRRAASTWPKIPQSSTPRTRPPSR
jgi:hypothetical protein